MEKAHVNIIPNLDEPTPKFSAIDEPKPIIEQTISSNDKENKIPEQMITMNASTITLIPTNDPSLSGKKKIYIYDNQQIWYLI
jgi:hypothetical protein